MAFFASALAHRDTIVMIAYPGDLQEYAASVTRKVQTNNPEIPRVFYICIAVCGVDIPWHLFRLLYSIVEDGDKYSKLPVRFSSV
jgi:hypothetical protein